MEFEFDSQKSQANQQKHGIDFVQAQQLWADVDRIEIPARTEDEVRFLVIGKRGEKHWSAVITYRGGKVRIISVRRSRTEEVAFYEGSII
ncbi:BrnT family toxin [Phormidesmis sp. 146-35]